ncbi:hypothetical protein Lesp02_70510 [Lentzea sp. NBRC 105346]|uniref:hypothetical protein n=1 Tax=Lentzea sp. NBRC 105346 TaxID=3032205 RepID=UPI0024A5D4FF|nr:hypothetical protein [Lentzea sp. NBRC 105346]GLZ34864.1 hypothetical protein Lesp02_70510 [Lentzea sp. NBRC 105346]
MSTPCRRAVCTSHTFRWLGDWCGPICQWLDLGESGVDLGSIAFLSLRTTVRKTDPDLVTPYLPQPVLAAVPDQAPAPEPAAVAVLDPPAVQVVPEPLQRRTIRALVRKWVLG